MKSFALKTLLVAMAASSSSATRVAMERDMPVLSQTDSWSLVAETPAAEPVSALFMLKHVPAQLAELEETFWAVSDPKNARYGQHLTRDQTQLLLAPAAGNVARLTAWLKANGVAESDIKFPNADMVEVATSVGVASQLFGSTFQTWTHSSGTTLNRVEAYTLPSDIAQLVEIVGGIVRLPEVQGPIVVEEPSVAEWPDACGSSCPGRVAPGILEQAYNFTPTKSPAAGNSMATAEFQGQKWNQKDMDLFTAACTPGFNATVQNDIGGGGQGEGVEALLDVEYIKAVAGDIPLTNVYSGTYNLEDYVKTLSALADGTLPLINSVSYGNDEIQQTSNAYMQACNAQFMAIGSRGVSILFASGDQGVYGRTGPGLLKEKPFHPDFPAASPYITAVGGTDFATKGVVGAEKVWSAGGGGFSNAFAIPAFQTDAVAAYKASADANLPAQKLWNNTGRGYPDISALGGQVNPYCVFSQGKPMGVAGTSASCPVASGIFAQLNNVRLANGGKPLGFLNPWIYQNGDAFNDVAAGVNHGAGKVGFTAVKGWDAATGWGTPNFGKLVTRL